MTDPLRKWPQDLGNLEYGRPGKFKLPGNSEIVTRGQLIGTDELRDIGAAVSFPRGYRKEFVFRRHAEWKQIRRLDLHHGPGIRVLEKLSNFLDAAGVSIDLQLGHDPNGSLILLSVLLG
jgi:hypothetical protein